MVRYKIRKCGLEGLYLSSNGTWVEWSKARSCVSQEAALAFADQHGETSVGLFANKCRCDAKTKRRKPRGWVFTKAGTNKEIGYVPAEDCRNADDAYRQFSRECGEDFDIYFRDTSGKLNSCADESRPEDFE